MKFKKRETVEFEYDDLPVIIYGRRFDVDDWEEREAEISWIYKVDKDDVKDFLVDKIPDDIPDEKIEEYLEEHFDELEEKYHEELLKYYRDDAIEDAQENNTEEYDSGPDPDEEYDRWRDEQFDEN